MHGLCSGIGVLCFGELGECHLLAGDLSGGGVNEEPLHEDLRGGVARGSVAGVILGLEVVRRPCCRRGSRRWTAVRWP